MSMQEQPDDEAANQGLDRLFRKSAEEFDPPYEPVAWQLMSAKLDERDRVTIWGRVLRGTLAIMALLVLLSGSWYVYKQNRAKTPTTGQLSTGHVQRKQYEPAENRPANSKSKVSTLIAKQSQQEIAGRHSDYQPMRSETSQRRRLSWPVVRQHFSPDRVKIGNPDSESERQETTVLGSKTFLKEGSEPATRPSSKEELRDKTLKRVVALNRSGSTQAGLVSETPDYTSATETTADRPARDSATFSSKLSRIGPLDALSSRDVMRWPQWAALTIPVPALSQADPATEKLVQPIRERGLSIRVAVSPDLSAVGIKNFTRPGTNYGLLVEYRFSNRFSVQLGAVQSKKVYSAATAQYAWPTYWKWSVKPIGVDGRCTMLDIPLNLRYDFALRPMASGRLPSRWFVSSGVTTYIMQQETYDYVYENPEDPRIRSRGWSGKTGRYTFSNLNLSVGYERPIGRRLAWQIEPFVKMPLTGIGYFKIDLLSTGAFLSLRYRL